MAQITIFYQFLVRFCNPSWLAFLILPFRLSDIFLTIGLLKEKWQNCEFCKIIIFIFQVICSIAFELQRHTVPHFLSLIKLFGPLFIQFGWSSYCFWVTRRNICPLFLWKKSYKCATFVPSLILHFLSFLRNHLRYRAVLHLVLKQKL